MHGHSRRTTSSLHVAQYVALESESPTKHEFFDGEIYAMAGGSEDHSALALNVLAALLGAVGDRPCRVHTSDLRIYVEAIGLATFPDGSVISPAQLPGPDLGSLACRSSQGQDASDDPADRDVSRRVAVAGASVVRRATQRAGRPAARSGAVPGSARYAG
ncbi:MAG TPA: Uma2 family endonuclease [Kofleriaceae bacterium]|nr:Uma2 family endonuclease [Kofleriaceae bacterium]